MREDISSSNDENILLYFLQICESLFQFNFEKVVVPKDFFTTPITQNFTISQYWNNYPKSNLARKLKSFRVNLIVFNDDEPSLDEITKLEEVVLDGKSSRLLREAFQAQLPAVSFNTHTSTHSPFLNIDYHSIEKDVYESRQENLIHICLSSHIEIHEEYLIQKRIEFIQRDATWDASKNPFPCAEITRQYLETINFSQNPKGITEGQRMERYLSVGTKVASLNGWLHDSFISGKNHSKNQLRRIFKSSGRKVMYLSIDVRHGEFEFLDSNGEQQAVYSFYGEKLKKDFDKNTHKITV